MIDIQKMIQEGFAAAERKANEQKVADRLHREEEARKAEILKQKVEANTTLVTVRAQRWIDLACALADVSDGYYKVKVITSANWNGRYHDCGYSFAKIRRTDEQQPYESHFHGTITNEGPFERHLHEVDSHFGQAMNNRTGWNDKILGDCSVLIILKPTLAKESNGAHSFYHIDVLDWRRASVLLLSNKPDQVFFLRKDLVEERYGISDFDKHIETASDDEQALTAFGTSVAKNIKLWTDEMKRDGIRPRRPHMQSGQAVTGATEG